MKTLIPMRLRFTIFTIRDLLWLTALAAVLVAWWVDHQRLTEFPDPSKPIPFRQALKVLKDSADQRARSFSQPAPQ